VQKHKKITIFQIQGGSNAPPAPPQMTSLFSFQKQFVGQKRDILKKTCFFRINAKKWEKRENHVIHAKRVFVMV